MVSTCNAVEIVVDIVVGIELVVGIACIASRVGNGIVACGFVVGMGIGRDGIGIG